MGSGGGQTLNSERNLEHEQRSNPNPTPGRVPLFCCGSELLGLESIPSEGCCSRDPRPNSEAEFIWDLFSVTWRLRRQDAGFQADGSSFEKRNVNMVFATRAPDFSG